MRRVQSAQRPLSPSGRSDAVRKPQPQSRYNVREYVLQAGIAAVCGCGSSLSLTVALAH